MPERPEAGFERTKRAAEEFSTRIQQTMDAATEGIRTRHARLAADLPTMMRKMWTEMEAAAARTGGKSSDKFKQMKGDLRVLATSAPAAFREAFGEKSAQYFGELAKGSAEFSADHISTVKAQMARVTQILSDAGVEQVQIDDLTHKALNENLQTRLAYVQESFQRELIWAGDNEARKEEVFKRYQQRVRATMTERGAAEKRVHEISGAAASRSIKASATEAVQNQGIIGQLSRRIGFVKGIAIAEQESKIKTEKLGGAVEKTLTSGQQVAQSAITGILKFTEKVMPVAHSMGAVTAILLQMLESFNRAKIGGATALGVLSVQGRSTQKVYGDLGGAMSAHVVVTDQLARRIGISSQNLDAWMLKGYAAAKTTGDLGDNALDFSKGLAAVGLAAPLAGAEANSAMQLVMRGQRVFGFDRGKEVEDYFKKMRMGAAAAKMQVEDYMSTLGNIEEVAATWNVSYDQMFESVNRLMVAQGAQVKGRYARGLVMGAMTSLSQQAIGPTLAMYMAGSRTTAASALEKLRGGPGGAVAGGDVLYANLQAFRDMTRRLKLGETRGEGAVKTALFLEKYFGTATAMRAMRDENVYKAIMGTGKTDNDVLKTLKDIETEADPAERGAKIADLQKDILAQISDTLTEMSQLLFRTLGKALATTQEGRDFVASSVLHQERIAGSMEKSMLETTKR